jgi:hypothetical protein
MAPAFFGYEKNITEKMIELGATVDFYDERSISNSLGKVILKINPNFLKNKTMRYYNKIINIISNNEYDYVLIIKCEMMPISIINRLKSIFNKAVFCLYLYDSIKNIKGINKKIFLFDRVLSFDFEDTVKIDKIIFRPLFFIDDYHKDKIINKYLNQDLQYDLSFIGTMHSDRYKIIKSVIKIVEKYDYKYFLYCYIHNIFVYYFYKLTRKDFLNSNINEFKFSKINSSQISQIITKSKVVLDIQHPKQTGLTIRTIEMIGMQKKIITTNQHIKNYDFYDPENITIINRNQIEIPQRFFNQSYRNIQHETYDKYSLKSWVLDVLGVEK